METGSLADLRHLTRTMVDAVLTDPPALQEISALPGVAAAALDGDRLTCSVETTHLGDLLARLGPHGIRSLSSQPPSLEELFMDQYRRGDSEAADHPEKVGA